MKIRARYGDILSKSIATVKSLDDYVEIEGEEVKEQTIANKVKDYFNIDQQNRGYPKEIAKIAKKHSLKVFDEARNEKNAEENMLVLDFIRERLEASFNEGNH